MDVRARVAARFFLEPPLTSRTLAAAATSAARIPNPWSSFRSVSASACPRQGFNV